MVVEFKYRFYPRHQLQEDIMTRRFLALFAAVALFTGFAAGCATEREARYTSTGAGIGAVTGGILGGVIGSMSHRTAEGVVIGSILGGLTGASVGNNEYRQERSDEAAAQYYSYSPREEVRDLMRIESISDTPNVVRPGEQVDLAVTYTVLSPGDRPRLVHEVREVRKEGQLIGRPEITTRRGPGTWTSSMPLMLPENAEPGTYVVTNIVETDSAGDSQESTFRVEPESRWRR